MRPYERVVILIKIYIFNFGALCSFGLTCKTKDFFVKIYTLAAYIRRYSSYMIFASASGVSLHPLFNQMRAISLIPAVKNEMW